jgi:hypothetical protein
MPLGLSQFSHCESQKSTIFPFSNSDSGGGIEEVHIHLISRVSHTYPKLAWVTPFQSSHLKRRALANFSRCRIPTLQDAWAYTPFPKLTCIYHG